MSDFTSLANNLERVMRKDLFRFKRTLQRLKRDEVLTDKQQQQLDKLQHDIDKSIVLRELRSASPPTLQYPDLPISEKKQDIIDLLKQHQVLIIAGETGSGKTTQLPKICIEAGRGVAGFIGHTQPRRLAARSVAQRIAEELGSKLGETVGFKIRFHEQVREQSLIKVMTDGILLAETQSDRFLENYDTLIIDEAHERSLNIDFLLGYLKWLLPKRPDLKLIITSATLDTEEFSKHFNDAPVIKVGGRSFPIDIRYRALQESEDKDSVSAEYRAMLNAINEIRETEIGDILVFFSGEREIREAAEVLRKHRGKHSDEVLPLYSRLNIADQQKIFAKHKQARIILTTNVAETSLTVPGVRAVIDFGKARISRYSSRTKLQRLPIEPIAQASANQRAGRCGRVGPGICIRLYDADDFSQRPLFTEPEILRTNLAAVILQMTMLRLGDIQSFPFLAEPQHKMIRDGIKTLMELNAFNEQEQITPLGKQLARLPIDPRLGRMILAAQQESCLSEMTIIAAGLSVQDPRDRPVEHAKAADQAHLQFAVEDSDFLGLLKIWQVYHENKKHLSNRKLRDFCQQQFISYRRMREWEDVHQQLMLTIKGQMRLQMNSTEAAADNIHRAILPGLLMFIGMREDKNDYLGLRNKRFFIHPGSGLFESKPKWVVSAEQVETNKIYARMLARIKPVWVEHAARHLSKHEYFDAHWSAKQKRVYVFERVVFSGLVLVAQRKIPYDGVDKSASREIFIRCALVQMDFRCQATFFIHNQQLIESVQYLQHKRRRPDLLVSEEALFSWFDARLPATVWDAHTLNHWLQNKPGLDNKLKLSRADVLSEQQIDQFEQHYPDQLECRQQRFELHYRLEPDHADDGVTVMIPLHQLRQADVGEFQWLIPGLLRDKVIGLIRSLPKTMRKHFVPVPDYADQCLQRLKPGQGALHQQLAMILKQLAPAAQLNISANMFDENSLADHLRMNFKVFEDEKLLAVSRNLPALQSQLTEDAGRAFDQIAANAVPSKLSKDWDFGEIPLRHDSASAGHQVMGYPALTGTQHGVHLVLYENSQRADYFHRLGLQQLIVFKLGKDVDYLRRKVLNDIPTQLLYNQLPVAEPLLDYQGSGDYFDDMVALIVDATFLEHDAQIRCEADFDAMMEAYQSALLLTANTQHQLINSVLLSYQTVIASLEQRGLSAELKADVFQQLQRLFYRGFVAQMPVQRLKHLSRYLKAIQRRMDKALENSARDSAALQQLQHFWQYYWNSVSESGEQSRIPPVMDDFRWSLEEYRVSLFAQPLKTAHPISHKRLEKQWDQRTNPQI